MPKLFEGTPQQVEGMFAVLDQCWPGAAPRLASDAFSEITSWPEVQIAPVPEESNVSGNARRGCSVAGGYLWQTTPPTLVVADSMSLRRQRFTLLHELGHHIQSTDLGLGTTLMEAEDSEAFEDAACDAFAARVLLPPALVSQAVPPGGPTAESALDLFHRSQASRAAICVRLVAELKTPGVVAVFDAEGAVSFAAARGAVYPPARGSDQSANPLVAAALTGSPTDRIIGRDDAQIHYSTGHTSNRLYGQIAWCDGLLFAVMVEYGASWKPHSPPQEATAAASPAGKWDDCETCGTNFVVKFTCPSCGEPRCPRSHCGCTRAAERQCLRCFLVKHPSQFDGDSETCSDCAS